MIGHLIKAVVRAVGHSLKTAFMRWLTIAHIRCDFFYEMCCELFAKKNMLIVSERISI